MSRGVVYTAILGKIRDQLRSAPEGSQARFVCFVDAGNPRLPGFETYRGWELWPAQWPFTEASPRNTPRKQARKHKCLAHRLFPQAPWSLYCDGSMRLRRPPEELLGLLDQGDICVFKHRYRNCLYQEAIECARLDLDDVAVIQQQAERYSRAGYPADRGLSETTCVLRKHSPAIAKLNEDWWREIDNGSIRDQLSFDYVCWRNGITPARFLGQTTDSPDFKYFYHARVRYHS